MEGEGEDETAAFLSVIVSYLKESATVKTSSREGSVFFVELLDSTSISETSK